MNIEDTWDAYAQDVAAALKEKLSKEDFDLLTKEAEKLL